MGHYMVETYLRFSKEASIALGHLPRILTELWTYYEPRGPGVTNECPYTKILHIKLRCKELEEKLKKYFKYHSYYI